MKRLTIMAAVAAVALMAAPGAANAEWYTGAAWTAYDSDNADVNAATGRLGYRFNPNFAVEGEGSIGIDDDDGAELDAAYGAYAVGIVPIGSSGFDVFGRAGYNHFDVDGGVFPDIEESGFSYGAGLGWRITPSIGLRADWTRTEVDPGDVDSVSLGAVVNF